MHICVCVCVCVYIYTHTDMCVYICDSYSNKNGLSPPIKKIKTTRKV